MILSRCYPRPGPHAHGLTACGRTALEGMFPGLMGGPDFMDGEGNTVLMRTPPSHSVSREASAARERRARRDPLQQPNLYDTGVVPHPATYHPSVDPDGAAGVAVAVEELVAELR